MMARQVAMIRIAGWLITLTVALIAGCDRKDSAGKQDQPSKAGQETLMTKEASPVPTSNASEPEYVRVPLGKIEVPEGTPEGEWLEIGGGTPLLWCYRGGKRLVFEQAGPEVYLSIDGKPFFLAGIIVRSKEEMLLIDALGKESDHRLALWVYSPHLTHLQKVAAVDSIDSVHIWEWGRGLLTDLSPLAAAKGLTSLCIRDCPKLVDLAPLRESAKLSSLDLRGTGVMEIEQLADSPLVWLDMRSTNLPPVALPPLTRLRQIQAVKLDAYGHSGAAMPLEQVLPKLASLQALTVAYAIKPDQEGRPFVPLGTPPKLSTLILDGLGGEPDLSSLASLKGMISLRLLGYLKTGVDLRPLSSLQALQALRVEVQKVENLEDIHDVRLEGSLDLAPLLKLKQLAALEIVCEGDTSGHDGVGQLPKLKQLVMRTGNLAEAPKFAHPENLISVDLSSPSQQVWNSIEDISSLGGAVNLQELALQRCGGIQDWSALSKLRELRRLDLSYSRPLDLSPLKNLPKIEALCLRDYRPHPDYPGLQPLVALEQLRELDLSQSSAGSNRPFDLLPIARLKHLRRLDLDLADAQDASLLSLPSLVSVSLPRNITTETLDKFVRQHPRLVRLRARGGGATFHEPLKADISSVRLLTNLTDLDIECNDLRLFGDMRRLTHVRMRPDLKTWGKRLALDSPAARNLRALRYLEVGGTYSTLRLPSTWSNIFRVDMFTLPGRTANVVGLAGDRGVHLFPNVHLQAHTR